MALQSETSLDMLEYVSVDSEVFNASIQLKYGPIPASFSFIFVLFLIQYQ